MDIYEFNKLIGSGMYGQVLTNKFQVYMAYHKLEGKNYAIKRINFKDINTKDRENIEKTSRLRKRENQRDINRD